MTYDGMTGQVELGDEELVITRDGTRTRFLFGRHTGTRRIPLGAIGSVHLKRASKLFNGYLQLGLGAKVARGRYLLSAAADPNVVMFRVGDNEAFAELHARLEAIIAANRAAGIDPASVPHDAGKRRND